MNSKEKGAVGVAKAIAYYAAQGLPVFVPVSDISRFDLVVLRDGKLMRVEVKTTASITNEVSLRTKGGNKSGTGKEARISSEDCDLVYCVNLNNGIEREFEVKELEGRCSVTLKG